jgi:protoporphyrinogen/coproporphyrinogen III oxidase
MPRKPLAVVVVGGGVGGMAAAYELGREAARRSLDVQVTVLEARERVGGSVVTERVDGCIVEGGPDCFVSEKPWAIELIEEVGLGARLAGTNDARRRTYVLWKGRPHPLPDGLILLVPTRIMPFITARLFSWPGKLRMALDLVLPRRTDGADETLGDFIRRRLGREALDKLGEPLVAGIHSGDPETMSIKATFPRFVDMEREDRSLIVAMLKRMTAVRKARAAAAVAASNVSPRPPRTMFMTLDEGLGELMTELTLRVGAAALRTSEGAGGLAARPGGGWTVRTVAGATYEADGVIFATPAYATAEILRGVDPELARELDAIPYVSSATVTLAYPAALFPTHLDGFGLVIPKGERRRVKAFTWVTSKFHNRAPADIVLMRCFIRATAGETDGLSEEDMAEMARAELADILGVTVPPLWSRAYRWDRAMPQYVVGHLERVERIDARLAALRGVRVAGGAYKGSGIPDTVRFSRAQARALLDDLTRSTEG